MESPNESAILSERSISLSFGRSAAIRQYPGRKSIPGKISISLTGVSLRTGRNIAKISIISHNNAIRRSVGRACLKKAV
jgi:hypothetical protein